MWARLRELTWDGEALRGSSSNKCCFVPRSHKARQVGGIKAGTIEEGNQRGLEHHRSQIYAVVVREIRDKHRGFLFFSWLTWNFVGQSKKWHISLPPTFHWLVSEHTSLKGTLGNEVLLCHRGVRVASNFLSGTPVRLWLGSCLGLSSHCG